MLLGLAGLSKSVDSATTKARNAKLKLCRHDLSCAAETLGKTGARLHPGSYLPDVQIARRQGVTAPLP
jgi:hypothetical protein